MNPLDVIVAALRDEFAVPSLDSVVRVVARLTVAALLGAALGWQRERLGKAAGLRTHMLVSLGAALFVLVPGIDGHSPDALSRTVQGIVTGVGFLGAGAIIKGRSADDVQGLTTAAGIWLTAAIGIACGVGREVIAIAATAISLLVLFLGSRTRGDHDGGSPATGRNVVERRRGDDH